MQWTLMGSSVVLDPIDFQCTLKKNIGVKNSTQKLLVNLTKSSENTEKVIELNLNFQVEIVFI